MNRDFDNDFRQEDDGIKGRSRRRDIGAGTGADFDTASPGRSRSGGMQGSGMRTNGTGRDGAGAAGRSAGVSSGAGGRPAGASSGAAGRQAGASSGAGSRSTGASLGAGSRSAGASSGARGYAGKSSGSRLGSVGEVSGGRSKYTGERPRYTGEGKDTGVSAGPSAARTSAGPSAARDRSGRAGGGVYDGAEDRGRDTSFHRNTGGASGRRASREAAAADPAMVENRYRRRMIIIFIVLEILFLLFLGGYRYIQNKMNLIQPSLYKPAEVQNTNVAHDKIVEMEGYWTIALFGVDSRNNSVGKGNNADVIIICNIDQKTSEIKLVSVFRDTYLNISDNGTYNKINQAYFLGGPEQAVEALNRNLDLQIDDYATFNWKAVIDAVNILGGVDVELSKAEFYYINAYITETVKATGVGSHQLKQAGPNHLDGVQAVAYARLRKMDTDFARTERQREIIDLCFQKLKKSDFSVVNNVMEVVFPQILSSITLDDVIPAAKNLTKYTIADTAGFPAARSDANMGKKGACVIPQTLESNVVSLHQFLFGDENYQPSDMVKKISAKISADTGMYNEAKPIDHVGTDGGYIPKPTEAAKATEKEQAREDESAGSKSETDESIIDGETDLEIETDEFGNVLDPPEEDWPYAHPGEGNASGTVHPGRPGTTAGESDGDDIIFPGAETSAGDQTTGPGAATRPGENSTKAATRPGENSTKATTSAYPGSTETATEVYPGSTQGTTEAYPGSTKGSTAAYPGSTTEEYVPEGPGSIIIGPGN